MREVYRGERREERGERYALSGFFQPTKLFSLLFPLSSLL
jgi:hypothetical protein